jgi:hypothetical protein
LIQRETELNIRNTPDVLTCLEYAAWLAEEQVTPIEEVMSGG